MKRTDVWLYPTPFSIQLLETERENGTVREICKDEKSKRKRKFRMSKSTPIFILITWKANGLQCYHGDITEKLSHRDTNDLILPVEIEDITLN